MGFKDFSSFSPCTLSMRAGTVFVRSLRKGTSGRERGGQWL